MTQATQTKHPIGELLARYQAIFQAAWQRRHELAGPARLADELAFLPPALSLQETPVHPAPRRIIWAVIAFFVIAVLWACFGQIDIVAVATGRIVVSDGTKLVQPLEASIVKAIRVQDGDKVKAGQVLIELDPTIAQADNSRLTQERLSALSEAWRSQALLAAITQSKPPALPQSAADIPAEAQVAMQNQLHAEWQDIQAQKARLTADIDTKTAEVATVREQVAKIKATLPLVEKREADFNALVAQGFVSAHASQDRTRARIEMEQDLATLRARREEVKAALVQAEQAKKAWQTDTLKTLNERYAKADLQQKQLAQESSKASQRERLTSLTAPVDGTVQQLAVHTTGGVVTPAQVLLVVVPEQAHVTADVTLENKDVGFVNSGQVAEIKLETFPYTRYGTVPAKVSNITADAVSDEKRGAIFPATLVLDANAIDVDGKKIKLAPGMNLTAEIKTGQQRVIEYLLSPLISTLHESLNER